MMTKLIHSMIRVSDLEKSIEFYRNVLGLTVQNQYQFDGFTLAYLANEESGFELELTYNHDQRDAYTHGSGYGHLAVSVEDIEQAHQNITAQGVETTDIKALDHHQKHLATFFFVTDPDGYKIEFLQRQGRYL
ncbi:MULTISPECIES: glyoxalase superfamily protein [unclassified Vibrio]|uniref:glyoxalase superfamily protein n=1 Tax=unclassified Vibrio TaxID=2614977 RepID=UPI003075B74F